MPRFLYNPSFSDVPGASALMNGVVRSRYTAEEYRTPLTIKTVVSGEAWYETADGGRYRVTPDVFLILNDGQRYSMDAGAGTETLCPFFHSGFVEAAAARADLDHVDLRVPVEFCARLYPMTGRAAAVLQSMLARRGSLEDAFYDLADALLEVRDGVRREVNALPGLRAATRAELYRRLCRARDFIHSCYAEPLSVEDVARVAALSQFHLHRTFRQAFGVSPMQYLQRRRLEVAAEMLARGEEVTTVCHAVGFESVGSFSSLVRRRLGVPPRELRSAGAAGRVR